MPKTAILVDGGFYSRRANLAWGNIIRYVPTEQAMKDVANGRRTFDQLGQDDFEIIGMKQTGVDMKIGLDVASLAQGRIVDQIILIADDTDFIPAIKVARRAGVDSLLDPMGNHVNDELLLQVDDIEDLHVSFRPTVTGARASNASVGTTH